VRGCDRAGQPGQGRSAGPEAGVLWQVVASQTEPIGITSVMREHHHAASDAPHLAEARDSWKVCFRSSGASALRSGSACQRTNMYMLQSVARATGRGSH
jgi:hypothetical protein